jgi:single-strand DNA-binding protein
MSSLNRVMLIGRLGADPEVRYTSGGSQVTNFTLATNEFWTGPDGKREERTEWHRIVAFGKLAEICGKYLNKGKQIYIGGKIRTRSWEDREGAKRYVTEIVAQEMKMLGVSPQEERIADVEALAPPNAQVLEDDIPF